MLGRIDAFENKCHSVPVSHCGRSAAVCLYPADARTFALRDKAPAHAASCALASVCDESDAARDHSGTLMRLSRGSAAACRGEKSFFFVVGSSFFAAGHALYAVYFLTHLGAAPRFGLIAFGALLYALYIALLLRRLRKGEIGGKMQVLAASYLAVISFMSLCAFLFAVTNGSIWHWMVFAASLLFLFSDSVLAYDKYYKKLKFRYLIVMSTYILAQAGITFGVYLTLGGH